MTEPNTSQIEKNWEIFICYRQKDGSDIAKWLYESLDEKEFPLKTDGKTVKFKVYWDGAAPAISNWKKLHKPALESSRALIVVCTPGLKARFDRNDWVHMELEWWLNSRQTAPIIIDGTGGEGERWLPETIRRKWPDSQRIAIDFDDWRSLTTEEREKISQMTLTRIVKGITESEIQTRFEDLKRQKKTISQLKLALIICSILVFIAFALSYFFYREKEKTDSMLALSTLEQAREAILRDDKLTAFALSTKAISFSLSPEIAERFLAIQYWAKGDFSQAQEHLKKVLLFEYQKAIDINQIPFQVDRLAQNTALRSAFDDWLLLTKQTGNDGYNEVLMFKGLNSRLDEIRRQILLDKNLSDTNSYNQLQLAEASLSNYINVEKKWDTKYFNDIQELLEQYKKNTISLNVNHEELEQKLKCSWSQIQQKLQTGEVILDFLKYHDSYAVWILKKKGPPIRIELGPTKVVVTNKNYSSNHRAKSFVKIERGISPFRDDDSNKEYIKYVQRDIEDLIWNPIEKYLKGEDTILYIIPDGELSELQFASITIKKDTSDTKKANNKTDKLNNSAADSILIDKKVISYLSYAQELLVEPSAQSQEGGMLLIGGVKYNTLMAAFRSTDKSFLSLPFTKKEITVIDSLSHEFTNERVSILTDTNVTEYKFRKLANRSKIIHISTHGWFSELNPKHDIDSLLFNRKKKNFTNGFLVSLDPTISSGLAFTGTSYTPINGINDGLLSAYEIAGLKLENVSLVVLAACNTVGQGFNGDGVLGLARGFKRAGVKNLIATLTVSYDAEETVNFFRVFYSKLLGAKLHPAYALREAILDCRRRQVDSIIWTPYVSYGPIR